MPLRALRQEDFFGRREEFDHLSATALGAGQGTGRSIVLAGSRGIGKTELLKQVFGKLFREQDRVAPFYYAVNPAVLTAQDFSRDFLTQFLCQRLALDGKDLALVDQRGVSVETVSALVRKREAPWAGTILDQYATAAGDPLNALRTALNAPHQSAIATGKPVIVMVDEFHLLKDLSRDRVPDPVLISLLAEPLSSPEAPHIVTGNDTEMQELAVLSGLQRMTLRPLGAGEATALLRALLRARGVVLDAVPQDFVRRLGGNPFYLRSCGLAPAFPPEPQEKDFWYVYFREIATGSLSLFWSSVLKRQFPDLAIRRAALELAFKILHADHLLALDRIPKNFPASSSDLGPLVRALHFGGFVRGEFGVFGAVEDPVISDFIESLYQHTVLGRPLADIEREFIERVAASPKGETEFTLILPASRDAELVAAKCIEQVGRNLGAGEEAIGQLQMAVIEAFSSAVEQGVQTEGRMYVRIVVSNGQVEVAVEGAEREFVLRGSGENGGGTSAWGVRLMKRFTDSMRLETTAQGTRVVLVKDLGGRPDQGDVRRKNDA
jgi:anti-sigma regulatory factor (Ser/Thr protein kinase)